MLFPLVGIGLLATLARAALNPKILNAKFRDEDVSMLKRQSSPYPANTIDMPIDHFPHKSQYAPHENGTFKQRYYFDSTYYEAGGPVFLYISGETSATNRFSNLQTGIIQILMQATHGLGVILENRFYGQSYPFDTSTTDQLRYLTTEQTIADNAYFAQHATFPGVTANISAPGTPWILYGGSLAGGETAFSVISYPDVLFGGIASSAPAEARLAYPEWYDPIQKFAPQDCIASVNGIVEKIDRIVASNNTQAITAVKSVFGLADLQDIRDFAQTIAWPLGGPFNYPLNTWQELSWNPAISGPEFFEFCGNITDVNQPANVTAIDSVLSNYTNGEVWNGLGGYANYFKNVYLPLCPDGNYDSNECFGTHNQTYWADPTNSAGRSYLYTTCTELGAYQVAPTSYPSLILKVLQVDYTQDWCNWAFPAGKYNEIPPTPDLEATNKYGGFNISGDRLAFIDGGTDVWLDLCYHSHLAPSPRTSSDLHPEYLIAGGGHHWDSAGILDVSAEPLYIQQAHLWEIRTVQKWLKTFDSWKREPLGGVGV